MAINPGDPKLLVTSQFPEKVGMQITLHQAPEEKVRGNND